MMADSFSYIRHQYDVWHFAKSLMKQLLKAMNKKAYDDLRAWIPSIVNHLWWSAAHCGGNAVMLREKFLSFTSHISNIHHFYTNTLFVKCEHGDLGDSDKQWLDADSEQTAKLMEDVTDKTLLHDLIGLTEFCRTGSLEVYHSNLLRWTPKWNHFSYCGMRCRLQVAALRQPAV